MKKVILFITVLLCISFVKAAEFRFEEGNDLVDVNTFYSCIQEDSKAYCFSNPTITSSATVHEIDLNTLTNRKIKTFDNNAVYTLLVKVGDKYIAAGIDYANHKELIDIMDKDFNILRSEVIENRASISSYAYKEINGDYYFMNQILNLATDYVAVRVSGDLETIEFVTLDDVQGEEFKMIRAYDEVDALLNAAEFSRIIHEIREYDGGYVVEHSPFTAIYTSLVYYKDNEIKWEKEGGCFGSLLFKDDSIYSLNEQTSEVKTSLIRYSTTGEILQESPITNINDQHRLFLGNFYVGIYNGHYYFFTYNPVDIEDFTTWDQWRVTKMSISSDIINKSKDEISVATYGFANDKIEITINKGYEKLIGEIIVKDSSGKVIEVSNNSFIMPDSSVTVEVVLTNENPDTVDNILLVVTILFITIILLTASKKLMKNKSR